MRGFTIAQLVRAGTTHLSQELMLGQDGRRSRVGGCPQKVNGICFGNKAKKVAISQSIGLVDRQSLMICH